MRRPQKKPRSSDGIAPCQRPPLAPEDRSGAPRGTRAPQAVARADGAAAADASSRGLRRDRREDPQAWPGRDRYGQVNPVPFGSPFDDDGDTRARQRRRDPDYLFGDDPGY